MPGDLPINRPSELRANFPRTNPNASPIQEPVANNLDSIFFTVRQLKMAMDSLIGQTGPSTNRAVTFDDLVTLGLTTRQQLATAQPALAASRVDKIETVVNGIPGDIADLQDQIDTKVAKAGDVMTGPLVNNYTGPAPTLQIEGNFNQTLGTDTSWAMFGEPAMIVALDGGTKNGIVGAVFANSPPGTTVFPTGVSGYGKLASASQGNLVFGLFGLAELFAAGGGMAVGGEVTARNYAGAPDTALPPNQVFGTTTRIPNGFQITAGGSYDCAVGAYVGSEDGGAHQFLTGSYLQYFRVNGLVLEAQASGSQTNIISRSNGNGPNCTFYTTTAMQPDHEVLSIRDMGGAVHWNVTQNGNMGVGTPAYSSIRLYVSAPDSSIIALVSGATKAIRFGADTVGAKIDAVDFTGTLSYQPLTVNGLPLILAEGGTEVVRITGGNVGIGTAGPVTRFHVAEIGSAYPATSGSVQSAGHLARFDDLSGAVLDIGGNAGGGFWLQSVTFNNFANNFPLLLNPNGGSVSIGTTVPLAKLHVFDTTGGATYVQTLIQNQGGGAQSASIGFQVSSSGEYTTLGPKGGITYQRGLANGRGSFVIYNRAVNDTAGYATTDAVLTIDNSGNVCVGAATPGNAKLDVRGLTTAGTTVQVVRGGPNAADTTTPLIAFTDGTATTVQGSITRNGAAAVQYLTTSDLRLKEDRRPTERGLDALLRINVEEHRLKGDDAHRQGLVAQELYAIYPEAVHVGGDDPDLEPWMIDYGRVMPLVIKAVQELAMR